MSRIILVILLIIGLGYFVTLLLKPSFETEIVAPEEIHYHAGFQVYKDNVLQDFSGLEYMHINPCSEKESNKKLTPEEEQIEKAHLHDNIGDVVHVHRPDALWRDLFLNIKSPIDVVTSAFINNEPVEDILDYPINESDSVVFFVGENENIEEKLKSVVTRERIIEVENKSENCGN